jgi:signal transduction histidine kinase
MKLKEIFSQLNFPAQCKRYGISIFQSPQFWFLVMGLLIIITALISYVIGTRYLTDPQTVVLIILIITTILFIIAFLITRSFERLIEVNRLKSEFIRVVSHQLRSPLTNVSWATDILLSGALGRLREDQLSYFLILKENNARMRELVKDLLLVSKLEEGALIFKKETISLNNLIENLISKFLPFARASNVEIKFESEKNFPPVSVDPHQIELVIETLLDNAIRYIGKKGKIEIFLAKKGENIFFKIKDTGIGIPKEDQKYIFQKFFRSKTTKRREVGGSGLGLFTAKSIIERMGGKIWFESEEGKGTTFYFTLPLK